LVETVESEHAVSNPTAKELLAQADQLMRRARPADDLPVLTELVRDTDSLPPTLEERIDGDAPIFTFDDMDLPEVEELDLSQAQALQVTFASPAPSTPFSNASVVALSMPNAPVAAPSATPTWTSASPVAIAPTPPSFHAPVIAISDPVSAQSSRSGAIYTREQFDAMLVTKLEEIQHSVYSQVMQQLELHATGRMRENLRASLEPTVKLIVDEITAQVADETAIQMQSVVSNAVDSEVARLREQLSKKRDHR
jgi:hypothetical protein